MDNIVGSASIIIRPELAGFAAELEAESAVPLVGFQKKAETAGKGGGEKFSKGFKGGMGGIESALGSLGLPLQTFGGRLDKTAASMANVESRGSKLGSTLAHVGGTVLLGTTAAFVVAGAAGVDLAMKYETATARIAATAGVGEKSAKQITDAFLNAAGKTEYSAKAVAQAYSTIAGELGTVEGHALKAAEATKVMAAAQNLTAATGGKLQGTTEALGKVMLAYHLSAGQAAEASDVLFNASQKTGTSVESLAGVIQRIRGRLGEFAPSLRETGGLMVDLTKHSVSGRQAMGALNGVLNGLIGANEKTKEAQKALGVEVFNSAGKFVGLTKVIGELAPKLHGLNEEQQITFLKTIGIKTGYAQLLPILLEGRKAYEHTTAAVGKHNAAQEAAKKAEGALQAQVKKLEAQLEALAIKLGNVVIPVLTKFAHGLSDGITWLKKHEAACIALGGVITTVLGGAIGSFVAVKVAAFAGGIQSMIAAGGRLVAMLLTTLVPAFGTAEAEIVAGTEATAVSVDAALIGTGIGATLVLLGAAAFLLKEHWSEVMVALEEAAQAMANMVIGIINELIEGVNELTSVLTLGLAPSIGKIGELSGAGGGGLTKTQEEGGKKVEGALAGAHQKASDMTGGIMAFFESKGLSSAQAAGIAGNFRQESSLNPNMNTAEGRGLDSGTGSRGHGGTAKQQLEAYWKELTGSESATLAALKKAHSAPEAARVFEKGFERAGKPEMANREKYASEALAAHPHDKNTAAVNKNTAAQGQYNKALAESIKRLGAAHTKATKAASKAAEAYVDPFASATGLKRSRTDQGVDFSFAGPLGAIGAGTIAKIVNDPGGFGKELVEKLTAGAHKGQYVYYGLETGATSTTQMGAHVRAGQEIARGKGSGGIEMGFASSAQGVPITPFAKGASHEKPTAGGEEFSKFLASTGKGGSALSTATAEKKALDAQVAALQKHEATRIASDAKIAGTYLSKEVAAIHSGKVSELVKFVGKTHDTYLHRLEGELNKDHKDALKGLAGVVEKEHASALSKLVTKLVETHKKALEALQVALVKAAEKAAAGRMAHEDVIHTDEADAAATAIGDATKVALDHAAEAGLTGAELIAAQAQTALDSLKATDDASVAAAKLAVDTASGHGEAAEAAAKQQLVNAENAQKVQEAAATQTLDLANNAATEAQKKKEADEKRAKEEEEATATRKKTAEEEAAKKGGAAAAPANYTFYISGANLTPAEIMAETGWALRTGSLPVAPPGPAHAPAGVA